MFNEVNFSCVQVLSSETEPHALFEEPHIKMGTCDSKSDKEHFLFSNNEGQIALDIKFTLQPALLSMLQRNASTRTLFLLASFKGDDVKIVNKVNGKHLLDQFAEGETESFIDHEGGG